MENAGLKLKSKVEKGRGLEEMNENKMSARGNFMEESMRNVGMEIL